MATIKHISFPFDFSKQGLLAAPFVRAIASRVAARITLLGVVPPIWDIPAGPLPALVPQDTHAMEQDLKSRLDAAMTKELAGLEVRRVVASGDPASKITEFANTNDVDLIMMPTHGCGMFRSVLLGSVTAKSRCHPSFSSLICWMATAFALASKSGKA